ncbi:MAG: AsnC family transcriptional regulator [Planctomycetota bacterium]|nr:AsnC family transcriptional regulator [Planctomycetota bacterium]
MKPELDSVDRSLINALRPDARRSGRELAKDTSLSEANISRRLKRLVESGSVVFRSYVPPTALGLSMECAVQIDGVDRSVLVSIATALTTLKSCLSVIEVDHNTIWAHTLGSSLFEVGSVIESALEGVSGYRLQLHPSSRSLMFPGANARFLARTPALTADLDEIDLLMLRILEADGRATFATIASQVDISPTAIAERFRKLEEAGVVFPYIALESETPTHPERLLRAEVIGPTLQIVKAVESVVRPECLSLLSGHVQLFAILGTTEKRESTTIVGELMGLPGIARVSILPITTVFKRYGVLASGVGQTA